MNVIVCVKQIPDPALPGELDPSTNTLKRDGKLILDESDSYGVEMALQLVTTAGGGEVSLVSMAPNDETSGLRTALAMGAAKAVLVSDPSLAGADALTTAKVLAAATKKLGDADLIIAGTESSDGYTGTVPEQLAEVLGLPSITFAKSIEIADGTLKVDRQTEAGYDEVTCSLPAVVSVTAGVVAKIEGKIAKEEAKAAKRFGDSFDAEQFRSTNPRVLKYQEQIDTTNQRLKQAIEQDNLADLKSLIEELGIADPVSGSRNWTEVRQFNLMFSTELGSLAGDASKIYLRPETAQGIFVNFLNVQKTGRMRIPFGIAQIGKAFRNEIIARQFIFRMREFEQMEMQFFVKPGEELQWYQEWKEKRMKWHKAIGLGEENYRFHDHLNLAHYANAACDIEFKFPMGFKELEGIHSRTDFDLKAHEQYSGKKLQFFDPAEDKSYVPYVIETSIGLDRLFLSILSKCYTEETLQDGSERTVLKLPAPLAPVKAAILPLVNKDGLPEKAQNIFDQLKYHHLCQIDFKDAIGRRYRRQDAIGTPFGITVDHQTLEDNTVTVRDRDTMDQDRVPVDQLVSILNEKCSIQQLLRQL